MKKLLYLFFMLGFISISSSQIQFNKVIPISFDTISNKIGHFERKAIKRLHEIPTKKINGLNFDNLKKELDDKHREDSTYKPIARAIPVNIDIIKEGKWEKITDSARICRMKVKVENSATLILVFDKFYLPEGSSLLIYDTEGKMVVGPLTSGSNRPGRKFMTHIIQGPELVFEYIENTNGKEKPEISISNIGVAFIYDYEQAKNSKSKNSDEMLFYLPPKPYTFSSEFTRDTITREGTAALCKVKNPDNLLDTIDPDPLGKIITSTCQLLIFNGGTSFDSKSAVLLKGHDDCTPYIATVAHVVHLEQNYEDYSVVRFNWFRKKPVISNSDPQYNNYTVSQMRISAPVLRSAVSSGEPAVVSRTASP